MALFLRQIRTLTGKTTRMVLWRQWLSTPLRALILPVLIVLFLSFTKNFISKDALNGFGDQRLIRPLGDMLGLAQGGRDRVIFVSGFRGGDIDAVIEEVSEPLRNSGVHVNTIADEADLRTECLSSIQGNSKCLGAIVFHGSATEGVNKTWNYTLRADGSLGTEYFADSATNDAQVYTIPLQHAVDFAIANHTKDANKTALSLPVREWPFTDKTEQERLDDVEKRYQDMIKDVLAAAFYLATACVVYQMTGYVATEQETGMARLLDTMMPNRKRWQPQVARIISNHLAFDLIYLPGWIASGAILGARCTPETMILIPIIFSILAGLSTTSFASFAAAFFRKAQLSGIIAIIVSLVLAIVAQIIKEGTAVTIILSLLFPPMNYVYCLVAMTRFEAKILGTSLIKSPPEATFQVPVIVFWLFAILHIIIFPIIGAFVERMLYGSTSSSRKTVVSESPVAVNLTGFSKAYNPGFMSKALHYFNKQPMDSVLAVDNLTLQAYRGEILVLLGANGSGKSTTLDAIAGQHSITSGEIAINYLDPREGFGYCPQKNIFWDNLTVREHVKIFDRIKSIGKPSSRADMDALIEDCDLIKKKKGISKSLSGGQKRKLQMAMMFAGGSTVCCVDEVSSGVDPLSRRKLWDILIAERGRRSIILTTHFLDEADLLADRISILSRGQLKAAGSSVELKHELGSGYRVHVHHAPGSHGTPPLYSDVPHKDHGHEITYFPGSSTDAHKLLRRLQRDGIENYEVNGPTLEDVFFKIEEKRLNENTNQRISTESESPLVNPKEEKPHGLIELSDGKPVGMFQQIKALMSKRFTIFRRNPAPYIALLAIALIAAGCASLFLQDADKGYCNPRDAPKNNDDDSTSSTDYNLAAGPSWQLTADAIERIAAAPPGSVSVVNTTQEFDDAVQRRYAELLPGGFFVGDQPIVAWKAGLPIMSHISQNLLNNILFNITITSGYDPLDIPFINDLSAYLLFIIYFGLSMAVYPAFLALYPTMERLRGIRSMHYSNGVRPLPLWLAYLLFDFLFVITISVVSITILASMVDIWYHVEWMLLIFLLYGIAAGLFAYTMSLFSTSQLAAFAVTAGVQAVFFLIYFVVFMVVFTFADAGSDPNSTLNIAYFLLGLFSPVVNLARAMYTTLNVFGVACDDQVPASYPGGIDLYGGPILYLFLQSFFLFGLIWWIESGHTLRGRKKPKKDGSIEMEAPGEFTGTTRSSDGLRVMRLRKQFKKHVAVDDVSFGIPHSECFALIGPNGAGKSTSISMIRGDIQPSSRESDIFIEGLSALEHRGKARVKLGVCPQIDPLDHMTVAEHLQFYAHVRGLKNPTENTQTIIKAVGLELFANRIASKLSGGNKRKLSLGISLVGNPTVLLLDEPSSGMDAVSKRIMWRTLSAITPGRSLLLTTHSMEEADALASSAGVIAGRMLALGTIDDLKARYGGSYYIHLVHRHAPHTSRAEMDRIKAWVQHSFPEARFDGWIAYGQVKFELPINGEKNLAEIFGILESGKSSLNVQHYNLSTATLDQIFLSVVGRHQIQEEGQ